MRVLSDRIPNWMGQSAMKVRVGWAVVMFVAVVAAGHHPESEAAWVEQGPGPSRGGQTEGVPNNPVSGGVNAVATDPTNPDIVVVGTVNGGIWRTANATSGSPAWVPTTDSKRGLSISSLAVSPTNVKTFFAGTGSTSSFGAGAPPIGVLISTNGGKSWNQVGAVDLAGKRINSIVPTTLNHGRVLLAATLDSPGPGVYRSTDTGRHFPRISNNGTSGLPDQAVSSLVPDPGNASRFYAAVPAFPAATGNEGVYRSDDGGVTWTPMNSGLSGLGTARRILLAVHNNGPAATNAVYAMLISSAGQAQGVFRSADGGGTWTPMGVPSPTIHPGSQGSIHGAIVADPSNANVVFVAGDRQNSPFPNTNGCSNFSANVFRGDAALLPGSPWQNAVCAGANGTSPHADARSLVFDANGNILHGNDGGITKLMTPNSAALRQWVSLDGNIRPSEMHSVAYDSLSNVVFGGTQDTGTTIQSAPGSFVWDDLLQGDGGKVAVDADQTAHPGTSIRYTSFQRFGSFNRTTWNASNTLLSGPTAVGLNITSGPGTGLKLFQFDPNIQFYTPYVLNGVDPSRMLIGTANIYESTNRGDSLANLGFQSQFITALAYGGRLSGVAAPDVFYVGTAASGLTPRVLHRVSAGGPITATAYPGGSVRSLVMDPNDYQNVYVVDSSSRVWASFDEGVNWTELTANLPRLSTDLRAIEVFSPSGNVAQSVLMVGGLGGVFTLRNPAKLRPTWGKLSSRLPAGGVVFDLHYDRTDNVVVASVLGRGAWTLSRFFRVLGPAAPEGNDSPTPEEDGHPALDASAVTVVGETGPARFDVSGPMVPPVAAPPDGD